MLNPPSTAQRFIRFFHQETTTLREQDPQEYQRTVNILAAHFTDLAQSLEDCDFTNQKEHESAFLDEDNQIEEI